MGSLNPWRVLSAEQIADFERAAERILEETGFRVQHEELLERAEAAGARVDRAEGRVRLPAPLLRELLAQVPPRYTIRNVAGGTFEVGGGTPGILAITNDPWIVDYETRAVRHPCIEDVRRHTVIAQKLDRVVCMSCMDYPVTDVPGADSSLGAFEEHLLHHTKHYVVLAASLERFHLWLELVRILGGSRDLAGSRLITSGVAVLSPLTLTRVNGDLLIEACAHDFPVLPTICPMAGTTAPFTLASTLLLAHCENVFLAALTQIVRPGNPFLYALGPSVSDLRSGHDRYYTFDKVLWKIGGVQLAKACGMPVAAECGGTMTHRYDPQSGAEGMLFMLAACASGADLLAGLGSCYNANGLSAEMMIIQEEWLRAAEFLQRGIQTEAHHLGTVNILENGPGGNFLTDNLTLEFMHGGEFCDTDLLDYSGGYAEGVPLLESAHERAEALTAKPESPIAESVQRTLRQYFAEMRVRGEERP